MRPPEHSLEILEAMLAELEAYLGSSELFWPLALRPDSSNPHIPRLTIGSLLLILDELSAGEAALPDAPRARLSRAQTVWQACRARHVVALERKAGREIEARLKLWQAYLTDLSEKPESAADYPGEVRNRLMISRLMGVIHAREWPAQLEARLQASDRRLQSVFRKGAFALAAALERVYPPFEFWFLYGAPTIDPLAG